MWPNRKQHRSGIEIIELDFGDRVGGRRHARAQHRRRSELIRPTSGSAHILNLRRSLLNIDCGLKQCMFCWTEYRIDLRHYEGHGLAMFLTRWKDLGPGPESEVWIQNLMPTGNPLFRADPLSQQASALNSVRIPIQLEDQPREGEIPSAFGDGADFNVDSLLSAKNKAELFGFDSCQAQ